MFRQGWGQFIPFMVTVAGIVLSDLLVGIALGIHVAVVVILFENYRLPFQIHNLPQAEGEKVRIALAQQVTFLNKASVLKTLDSIPAKSSVEIDASASVFIHPDVVEIINNYVVGAKTKAIEVTVIGLDRHHQVGRKGSMKIDIKYPSNSESEAA